MRPQTVPAPTRLIAIGMKNMVFTVRSDRSRRRSASTATPRPIITVAVGTMTIHNAC